MSEKNLEKKLEANQENNREKNLGQEKKADSKPEKALDVVSRAEYERLRREMTAERLLTAAGARNLTAAKALLAWQDVDLNAADWEAKLAGLVQELRHRADSAFLFAHDCGGNADYRWLGLEPAAAGDTEDIYGGDGGYAFRLAQADGVDAIKIKQEAATKGIIL